MLTHVRAFSSRLEININKLKQNQLNNNNLELYLEEVEPCDIPHKVRSSCFTTASSPVGIES